jgi:hypothetical protein
VLAKARANAMGHTSAMACKRQLTSVAEPSSDKEAAVVKQVKKARPAPEVEDEVVNLIVEEESEDIVDVVNDNEMEEREVSLYPHT